MLHKFQLIQVKSIERIYSLRCRKIKLQNTGPIIANSKVSAIKKARAAYTALFCIKFSIDPKAKSHKGVLKGKIIIKRKKLGFSLFTRKAAQRLLKKIKPIAAIVKFSRLKSKISIGILSKRPAGI